MPLRIFAIIPIFLAILIAACSTVETLNTREKWLSESSRTYPDKSPEAVIAAAEKVIRSVDPKMTTFTHSKDGFDAHRHWMLYLVITAIFGTDSYQFRVEPSGKGSKATLIVRESNQDSTIGSASSRDISSPSTYRVFFSWLDYALGKSTTWLTCEQHRSQNPEGGEVYAHGFCGPGNVLNGISPVEP